MDTIYLIDHFLLNKIDIKKKNEIFDLEYINRENMHRSDHLTNIKRKRIHAQCICVFYFLSC